MATPLVRNLLLPTNSFSSEERNQLPGVKEIYKRALDIAWPATVEAIFIGLAGLINTVMVSALGTTTVAAVGLTNQPRFICLAFILSLDVGVTAVIARRIGEGDMKAADQCLRQALFLCLVISLLVCGLAALLAEPFIWAAGARSDTIDLAVRYFRILMVGQFFQHLCLTINTAQRCGGNSKLSMKTNVTANVVNVVFNYLLIGGNLGFPAMGAEGAALATSLGSFLAFLMALISLFTKGSSFHLSFRESWLPTKEVMQSLWKVASSAFVENFCLRLGFFIYVLIVANLGTVLFATHQICMNIVNLTFSCFDGFATASAALVGQHMGMKKNKTAELYGKICNRLAMILATVIFLLFVLFRYPIVGLFTRDPFIISYGSNILLVVAAGIHIDSASVVYAGCLRGAGDTRFVAVTSLISTTLLRPFLSWLLCYPVGMGLIGPWIGLLIDFYLRGVWNILRFSHGKWKSISL